MGYKVIPVTICDDQGFACFTVTSDDVFDSASVALATRKRIIEHLRTRFENQGWIDMIADCAEGPGDPEFDALVEQILAAIREDGFSVDVSFSDEHVDTPPPPPAPPAKRILTNTLG